LLERIGLVISSLLVLPLAILPFVTTDLARSLQEMGGPQSSMLVGLALSRWFSPSAGALVTLAVYLARREQTRARRQFWTAVAIVVVGSAATIVAAGLFSPLASLRTMTAPLQ
jgi:hypothetical protein